MDEVGEDGFGLVEVCETLASVSGDKRRWHTFGVIVQQRTLRFEKDALWINSFQVGHLAVYLLGRLIQLLAYVDSEDVCHEVSHQGRQYVVKLVVISLVGHRANGSALTRTSSTEPTRPASSCQADQLCG